MKRSRLFIMMAKLVDVSTVMQIARVAGTKTDKDNHV